MSTASCSTFFFSGTEAANTFLTRLFGKILTQADQLHNEGAAVQEIQRLINIDHPQVIRAARCNIVIEQVASVVSCAVLPKAVPPTYTASGTTTAGSQSEETNAGISQPACQNR